MSVSQSSLSIDEPGLLGEILVTHNGDSSRARLPSSTGSSSDLVRLDDADWYNSSSKVYATQAMHALTVTIVIEME